LGLPESSRYLYGNILELNDAFAAYHRFKNKEECPRTYIEFSKVIEKIDAEGKVAPLETWTVPRALRGESATGAEYKLRRIDTGETWIGSYTFSPIRDRDGSITGAVVTARDITQLKRAESRLRRIYETDLFGVMYWRIDGAVLDANNRYLQMSGYTREEMQAGLLNWSEITPQEYRDLDEDARRQIRETGVHLPYEKEFYRKDGTRTWGLFSAAAFDDNRNEGISFILDINKRKRDEEQLNRLNRTLKAMSYSNQALLHATGEPEFLAEVCRIISDDCGHLMVWIGAAEHDERKSVRPLVYAGFEAGYLDQAKISWADCEFGRGPVGTAIRNSEPTLCRNISADESFAPWRGEAIRRGYASVLAIPVKQKSETWGVIAIYSSTVDAFSEGEVNLLMELAGDLEFGIGTLRMRAAHLRAEEALRDSESKLGIFVDHAPAALAMFDQKMRYLYASRRWKADYGLEDSELKGRSHYDLFPEIPPRWRDAHRRGLSGEVLYGEADRFERADGAVQWIRWELRPWFDGEGRIGGIVIFSEDITERRDAVEELRSKEARLRLALDAARSGTWEWDVRTNKNTWSDEIWQLYGLEPYSCTPSFEKWLTTIHSEDREMAVQRATEAANNSKEIYIEYRVRDKDGSSRWLVARGRPLFGDGNEVVSYIGIAMDITERKRAEEVVLRSEKEAMQREQLRALAARLQRVREEERTKVARDLHDQLGQIMTAIKMDVMWMAKRLTKGQVDLRIRLLRTTDLLNDGMQSIRAICSGLRPGILDDLGLAAAIEWQANEFAARTGVHCEVSIPIDNTRLEGDAASAVFRIFQECLTNISRHAEAHRVRVSLNEEDDLLSLIVEDDGKGFNESEVAGSLGLLGMRERAQVCCGDVTIDTAPGKGTAVTIRIPLRAPCGENE
jgi:PAS domain S-box-containing protein